MPPRAPREGETPPVLHAYWANRFQWAVDLPIGADYAPRGNAPTALEALRTEAALFRAPPRVEGGTSHLSPTAAQPGGRTVA